MRTTRRPLLLALVLLAATFSSASELGDRLNRELKGGWGVLEVEVFSACGGTYSNNEVGAAGVASKARYRFAEGELVKIDNVKVKRQRVDLMLTLDAPLRVARMDGPFELYDQRRCQVQLQVFVAREMVKNADFDGLMSEVRRHIAIYPSRDQAELSDGWNGREEEPLPADYDETLQRHAVWKAEQTNTAVRESIEDALTEAAEAVEDIDDDADYLAGFAQGSEKMTSFTLTNCSSLLGASFTTYRKAASKEQSRSFKDGWDDGQKLVFHILLADRLRSCLVPVPPAPAP